MLIPADTLPDLVFVGTPFNEERFEKTCYHFEKKPSGGLWTSPIRDGKSEWEHYMVDEKDKVYCYLLNHKNIHPQKVSVGPGAKVFLISSDSDADYLELTYRWEWKDIANDYDAVYVDKPGVQVMHEGNWDLPSVLFFNLDHVSVGENE